MCWEIKQFISDLSVTFTTFLQGLTIIWKVDLQESPNIFHTLLCVPTAFQVLIGFEPPKPSNCKTQVLQHPSPREVLQTLSLAAGAGSTAF